MEEIILSWNILGDGGAQELAIALPKMEKLKVLDLEKNRIGASGATKLMEELAKCPGIQFIRSEELLLSRQYSILSIKALKLSLRE
ncbi:hypothetical protein TURU_000690 [Turdus rufiventris]|nr:hypothetical protein TURU_000690 [Turdus rufiventris]